MLLQSRVYVFVMRIYPHSRACTHMSPPDGRNGHKRGSALLCTTVRHRSRRPNVEPRAKPVDSWPRQLCAICKDKTSIMSSNYANVIYKLCCAIFGCWLTDPLNKWLGRRGTIMFTAAFSFLTCIWQGVTNSWPHLFVSAYTICTCVHN